MRRALGVVHRAVRAVGILVVLALAVGAAYIYLSPDHELQCDVLERVERERAGKRYWCVF